MIDDTGTTLTLDNPIPGTEPGSWDGLTYTLPTDLPAYNQPGNPATAAAAAAGGVAPPSVASMAVSSITKVAIGLGIGAVLLGFLAVATAPPKRRSGGVRGS